MLVQTRIHARPKPRRRKRKANSLHSCDYALGGRRRSWNHARYCVIFARWADGACRLPVEASSLFSGAPQRSSTESFTLYAISRARMRLTTSFNASVHWEPSVREYENLRDAISEARTL